MAHDPVLNADIDSGAPVNQPLPNDPRTGLRGRWIWLDAREADRNVYAFFRRSFRLDGRIDCTLHITADSVYLLYVDGRFIARGPARSHLNDYSFDSHAMSLEAGDHVIAVLVHHVGEVNATMMLGRPGLFVDCSTTGGMGEGGPGGRVLPVSNGTWRCRASDAWRKDLPEMMSHFGFWEDCDVRRLPAGWTDVGFDDSTWRAATVIGTTGSGPWTRLVPRDIPPLRRVDIAVVAVSAAGRFMHGDRTDPVLSKQVSARTFRRERADAALPVSLRSDEAEGSFVTLDFGRTVSGYPRLVFEQADDGAVVDLSYDELLTPPGVADPERTYAHQTDRFTLAAGANTVQTTHPRGFRYLTVGVPVSGGLVLASASVTEETYPFDPVNRLDTGDAQLDGFLAKAAETVRICTHDAFMDCSSRERVQWMEDMIMHARVAACAFGDTAMARRSLLQAAQCRLDDGRINGFFPSDRTNCAFAAGSLMWLHMLADHWQFTGQRKVLERLAPAVRELLGAIRSQCDERGVVRRWPAAQFWEWSPVTAGANDCLLLTNAFWCLAIERLLDTPLAELLPANAADELVATRRSLHELFWVDEHGLYRDALPDAPVRLAQSANALAVRAGICPAEHRRQVLQRLVDPGRLGPMPVGESTVDKAPPPEPGMVVPTGTLLMASFICEALFEERMDVEALAAVRRFWGPYKGLPTFPEVRVQGDNSGLCHAWSAGPAALLPHYLLGVQPQAGWERTLFEPHPGEHPAARGSFRTSRGTLAVRWERSGEAKIRAGFDMPEGVTVLIGGTGETITGPGCREREVMVGPD